MAIYTRTNDKPSNPTNRMWSWGLVGFALTPFIPVIGAIAGGVLGYNTGVKKQQNELESGVKKLKTPTLINGGMARGWLLGGVVGFAVTLGVTAAILIASGGTAAAGAGFAHIFMGAVAEPAMLFTAALWGGVSGVATNIAMIVKGAFSRRNEMREDYNEAMADIQRITQERAQNPQPQLEQKPQLSLPEKAQSYQFDNSEMADKRAARPWGQQVRAQKPMVASSQSIA